MFKLRNHFINTTSMLLAPPNEGEDDNRSDAQKQRDAISISDSTDDNKDDNNKEGDDNNDADDEENKEDDEEADENDEENDEDDEGDKDEEDKDKQETEAEKSARIAKEKEDKKQARIQRKFDKIAAEKTAAEKRVKELEAQIKETPVEGLTEEEVDRRASEKAAAKLAEKAAEDARKQWENTCDALEAAAIKANKDFPKAVNELTEELGPIPGAIISILSDLDNANGGEVLAYLASNVEEAEDLFELKETPHKLAMKLTRLSDKLKEAKKTPRRERSALPPPIDPLGGNSRDNTIRITGKETQEEYNAKRARQIEEKRKQRGY